MIICTLPKFPCCLMFLQVVVLAAVDKEKILMVAALEPLVEVVLLLLDIDIVKE